MTTTGTIEFLVDRRSPGGPLPKIVPADPTTPLTMEIQKCELLSREIYDISAESIQCSLIRSRDDLTGKTTRDARCMTGCRDGPLENLRSSTRYAKLRNDK